MSGKMARTIGMVVLMLLFSVFFGGAFAQDKTPDQTQILIDAIKADKKLLVSDNMQLSNDEAKGFWPIYEKYQSELFLIRARTAKLIENYAASYNNMTDLTARKLLEESMTIESLRIKLNKDYLSKFRKVLPDIKVVRYYQIENKINAILYYDLARQIPLVKTGD